MEQRIRLDCGGEVVVRRSARARRMALRVARATGVATLTLPAGAGLDEGRRFIARQADWLRRALAAAGREVVVAAGARLPVRGTVLTVTPAPVRLPEVQDGLLLVPQGRPAGAAIAGWLREMARADLAAAVGRHAVALHPPGRPVTALVLRDTRSRWGSCSAGGRLMFSWRLAMAPPAVLDYVAAHEVGHLVRMDHSAAFWAVVEGLCPAWRRHRDWLRHEGLALQAWRFRTEE